MKESIVENLITIIAVILFSLLGSFNAVAQESGSSVFVFKESNDSAVTVDEFVSKSEEEQIKIVERLMLKALKDTLSGTEVTGNPKSPERLKTHRILSKLIQSHFLKSNNKTKPESLKLAPDATIQIRRYVVFLKSKNELQRSIWNIVVTYFKIEYKKLYEAQTKEWKRKFALQTSAQQESYFAAQWQLKAKKEFDVTDGLDLAIAMLEAENAILEEENKNIAEEIKDSEKRIKEREENIAVAEKALKMLSNVSIG